MYFRHYGLPKTWLDQYLKSPVLEHPFKSNMVKAHKHCSSLKDTSFTIFIDHWVGNCLGKSLCCLYAKSQNYFLPHRVPMGKILFLIEAI